MTDLRWPVITVIAVFGTALLVLGNLAQPRVAFIRPPAATFEGYPLYLQVQVTPDAQNRRLVVAAIDGPFVLSLSAIDLDGERAARTHWIRWEQGLTACECQLAAGVYNGHLDVVARDVRPITVISRH